MSCNGNNTYPICKTNSKKMSLREIDLNENIASSESNQERQQYYIPDLNVSIEELGVGFNQSPSRNSLPFDLNDEPFIEDDTQIEEILQQLNSNTSKYRLYIMKFLYVCMCLLYI